MAKQFNPFENMTLDQLDKMYPTYKEFIRTGVISSDTELGRWRDEYCSRYDISGLRLMIDNYLNAVVDEALEYYRNRQESSRQ